VHDNPKLNYRPDIDGLRGVAVLAVLIFHAFPEWLRGGFVGVDIFFVISGFLITRIILGELDSGTFGFASFYERRIKRIFPALSVVLLISWGLGFFILISAEFADLGRQISASTVFVSNFVLWKDSGYFDSSSALKPLLHLWSLGIEEQFYILWPLFLYVTRNHKSRTGWLIATVLTASFALNILAVHRRPTIAFYFPVTRAWELMLGGVLAYAATASDTIFSTLFGKLGLSGLTKTSQRWNNLRALVGAGLCAIALAATNSGQSFPGWWALLPTLGAFLLISAGPHAWLNRKILANPLLVFIGLISYPLYLWHWPLLSFARIAQHAALSRVTRLELVAIAVFLAWLTYAYVEKPIRRNRARSSTRIPIILSSLMAIIGCAGLVTSHDGFEARFPEPIRYYTNYQAKYDTDVGIDASFRQASCFLLQEHSKPDYADSCVDRDFDADRNSIYLWGDSHAAHLYPGLRHLQAQHKFKIAQFTAAGCGPFITIGRRDFCSDKNDYIVARLGQLNPHTVILSANWLLYDLNKVEPTVAAIKSLGIPRTVLVGPAPQWPEGLPKNVVIAYFADPAHRLPIRLHSGSFESVRRVDEYLATLSAKLGITYISAVKVMCDQNGCLTRVGSSPLDLTAFDYAHLTVSGSTYLVDKISSQIFGQASLLASSYRL
jgi:peptidoglycan/LPS O-acetylase OafA/YrhL